MYLFVAAPVGTASVSQLVCRWNPVARHCLGIAPRRESDGRHCSRPPRFNTSDRTSPPGSDTAARADTERKESQRGTKRGGGDVAREEAQGKVMAHRRSIRQAIRDFSLDQSH